VIQPQNGLKETPSPFRKSPQSQKKAPATPAHLSERVEGTGSLIPYRCAQGRQLLTILQPVPTPSSLSPIKDMATSNPHNSIASES